MHITYYNILPILTTPSPLTPVSELDINWGIVCESGAFARLLGSFCNTKKNGPAVHFLLPGNRISRTPDRER